MSAVKSNGVFQSTPIRGIPLTRRSIVVTPLSETPDLSTREERLSNIDRSVARSELSVQITPRNTNKLTGYKECFKSSIKLFQMNKITKQNAWDLNLIHDLYQLTDLKDKMIIGDLNLASVAIDASAKIYALRVDDVHQDIVRLASGLMHTENKSSQKANQQEGEDSDNNDDGVDNNDPNEIMPKKKKIRKRNIKSLIVTDLNQIDKEIETIPELDKLFTCRAAMSGEGLSADKMYRLTLECVDKQLLTGLEEHVDITCHQIKNASNNDEISLSSLTKCEAAHINASLHSFKFLDWSPEKDKDSNARFIHSDGLLNSSQLEITFDINAEVEKIPNPAADLESMDYDDNAGQMFFENNEDEDEITPVMMRNGLNMNQKILKATNFNKVSEYSYNPKIKNMLSKLYAGPLHWKYPLMRRKARGKSLYTDKSSEVLKVRQAKKNKQFATIDLDGEVDETKFKCKSLHKLKGSVLLNWNPVKNLLPDKLHLTCDSVNCHFMTPYKSISVESDANATCMDDIVPEYNYENNNDSNFCAVVENDEDYSADENEPAGTNKSSEGYVDAPDLVNQVKITYDTKARTVNMKLIKSQTLKIIDSYLKPKDTSRSADKNVTFSQIYKKLHEQLPAAELTNLTQGIALLSVMHITNDNDLVLTQDDTHDFVVSLPVD